MRCTKQLGDALGSNVIQPTTRLDDVFMVSGSCAHGFEPRSQISEEGIGVGKFGIGTFAADSVNGLHSSLLPVSPLSATSCT
jgi:hypothetical protein